MAAQTGRTLLLKLDVTGSGSFQTIGGLRTKSIKINNETVDVTTSDSTDQWRELLATAGVKSIEASGAGLFTDTTYEDDLVSLIMADTHRDWQIIVPGLGTFEGKFAISNWEANGEYNGPVQATFTLQSADAPTFTGA